MCHEAEDDGRCGQCPFTKLAIGMESSAGLTLRSALDIDFALTAGVRVGFDEIPATEFRALKIIRAERDRKSEEDRPRQTGG